MVGGPSKGLSGASDSTQADAHYTGLTQALPLSVSMDTGMTHCHTESAHSEESSPTSDHPNRRQGPPPVPRAQNHGPVPIAQPVEVTNTQRKTQADTWGLATNFIVTNSTEPAGLPQCRETPPRPPSLPWAIHVVSGTRTQPRAISWKLGWAGPRVSASGTSWVGPGPAAADVWIGE